MDSSILHTAEVWWIFYTDLIKCLGAPSLKKTATCFSVLQRCHGAFLALDGCLIECSVSFPICAHTCFQICFCLIVIHQTPSQIPCMRVHTRQKKILILILRTALKVGRPGSYTNGAFDCKSEVGFSTFASSENDLLKSEFSGRKVRQTSPGFTIQYCCLLYQHWVKMHSITFTVPLPETWPVFLAIRTSYWPYCETSTVAYIVSVLERTVTYRAVISGGTG